MTASQARLQAIRDEIAWRARIYKHGDAQHDHLSRIANLLELIAFDYSFEQMNKAIDELELQCLGFTVNP